MDEPDVWPDDRMLEVLFELAERFRQAEPWAVLTDDDLFRFTPPDGPPVLCVILGGGGEVFGVGLYPGEDGLRSYRMMVERSTDSYQLVRELRTISATFRDRDELETWDLAPIRRLGLKYRGRNRWPVFQSWVPGYLGWKVTAEETKLLLTAMSLAMWMTEQARSMTVDFAQARRRAITDFTLNAKRQYTASWAGNLELPEPRDYPRPELPAELADGVLARAPRTKCVWEIGSFYTDAIVAEKDKRPYNAEAVVVIETPSLLSLALDVTAPHQWPEAPLEAFLGAMEQAGGLPLEVHTNDPRIHAAIAPVLESLRVRHKHGALKGLRQLEKAVRREFGG